MNIQQAKEEIINALKAYLAKDGFGNYLIPAIRQRPILLMGPPGIGKTQIMEQVAAEAEVGLVAYTITHHTRQSAVGLPFIEKRVFDGKEYAVTGYTMSEILASVHHLMERTGLREGILFLDEINCVSETLAPMMLQFLQCKTFGNQRLPEGWLIVAAGNPPEYNKSVREFDMVTLDRVRRMDVEADFTVWKAYASRKGLHSAILSYLDLRKEHFYCVENTVDGLQFVTARGWEDLSELMMAYERLGLRVDRAVAGEYLQLPRIAREFADYLDLYDKYRRTYHVSDVLRGQWSSVAARELRAAPFDEKLAVMGLLLSGLSQSAREVWRQDALTVALHAALTAFKAALSEPEAGQRSESLTCAMPETVMEQLIQTRREALTCAREAGRLETERRDLEQRTIEVLEEYLHRLRQESDKTAMDAVRTWFADEVENRARLGAETGQQFTHAFQFLEEALGEGQELVLFVTEITAGFMTSWFIEQFGCEAYFRYNRELLFDDRQKLLREKIAAARRET